VVIICTNAQLYFVVDFRFVIMHMFDRHTNRETDGQTRVRNTTCCITCSGAI